MRLTEVRLFQFRALADVEITLRPLTVLIGENNVGKSGVLRGLEVALGAPPVEDDFHILPSGLRASDFTLDVRFEPWDGTEFDDHVADVVGPNMNGLTEATQYFAWRATGRIAADGSGVSCTRRFLTDWPAEGDDTGARLTHQDLSLVSFFLLDAKRDFAEDQRSPRSFWGRLLSDIEITDELSTEIEAELRRLSDKVVGSSEILAAARTDLGNLATTLGSSIRTVGIEPLPARVVEVARSVDVVVGSPGGHALPMRLQGQGTRSVAAVLAFHAFTELRLGKGGDTKPTVIAGFEEPEAHLHPQAQRAMFSLIDKMDGQRLVSSHSPLVASHARLEEIVVMRQGDDGVECLQVAPDLLVPPTLSVADREKLERLLLRNHSECLFARLILLVEGDTEEAAIPHFGSYALGCDLVAAGVTVLNVGGAGNFKHFVKLLDFLKIPFILLADGDTAGVDGVAAAANHAGGALMPDEVFVLPGGHDFDSYLIEVGFLEYIKASIEITSGVDALELWGQPRHGKARKDGSMRNYVGVAQEAELVLDYCRDNKGLYGGPAAESIVRSLPDATGLPSAYRALPDPLGALFQVVSRRVWGRG